MPPSLAVALFPALGKQACLKAEHGPSSSEKALLHLSPGNEFGALQAVSGCLPRGKWLPRNPTD